MKALSIKQPWADMIAQGTKTIELRSWATKFRGRFLIVSSLKPDEMKVFKNTIHPKLGTWCEDGEYDSFHHLGAAICTAELFKVTDFEPSHCEAAVCDFYTDLKAWHLRDIKQVRPVKIKGKLSFYEVDNNKIIEL